MVDAMELDPTILERLQELRQWQVEQQERLMKQQQEQREMLSHEQDRMYQALSLSVQSIALDESVAKNLSESQDNYGNGDIGVQGDTTRGSGRYDLFGEHDLSDERTSRREEVDNVIIKNEPTMSLRVPSLQLNSKRHLNYQSSIEAFSPRFEIPSDCDRSVVLTSLEQTPEKGHRSSIEVSIEGVEPFPAEKLSIKHMAIDDMPVPSPKKDFTTMLEERLRDCEAAPDANAEPAGKTVIKRPFLKKGEGLARFKPNSALNRGSGRTRPRSASWSANMHHSSSSASKGNASKPKDTPRSSRTSAASRKNLLALPVAQSKLNLKNVPQPKKKVRSKSMSAVSINRSNVNNEKVKTQVDMNISSDFETKQRRELEEMRIFELLEEKAENSSFCSNSSTVLALFRQSTPLKPKNLQKNGRDPKQRLLTNSTKHDSSDTSLEEIVRTTKSNKPAIGSPVTKIRETVVQKDIVFSKWDSGPFSDENTNANLSPNNSKHVLQRAVAAGTYKSMQHTKRTTIQFDNNNVKNTNNNNNDDNRKPVVHSDDEDVCNISCSTNVDVAYDTNCGNVSHKERTGGELPAESGGANVSLHVRFSEYNEYKTIGLTDTSMMSNDPNPTRGYIEDKAWSDRSTSPDSSDVEVLFSKNNPKISPKNSVSARILTSSRHKNDSRVYKDESTDQTTDDEQYTSTCSTDASYEGENTVAEANLETQKAPERVSESDDASDVCNDSGSTIRQENDEAATNSNGIDSIDVNGTIFKSELLKTRLLELEREISIFRKENATLANQRKRLQEEQKLLQKEFRQKEDNLDKERKSTEEIMQEEKKRLAREKSALENRLRDAREKSLQSKQERQEMQVLREQLEELREDLSQKESRWQAAQARQKSQIRVLQTENAKLKEDLEKLRQLRSNKSRFRRPQAPSNTRAIHQINKQLESKKKISPKKDTSSDEETAGPREAYAQYEDEEVQADPVNRGETVTEVNDDGSKMIVYNGVDQQAWKNENDVKKKRTLYTDLLNDATQGLRGREEIIIGKSANMLESSINRLAGVDRYEGEDRFGSTNGDCVVQRNSEKSFKRVYEPAVENNKSNDENVGRCLEESSNIGPIARNNHSVQQQSKRSPERQTPTRKESTDTSAATNQDIREVVCPDGHIEYWYPNGNVKKVFPDRNVTKTIYYNGDVRESTEDGGVKYFYASTRTWHTTLPDGLEVLEFPDGQVERREKNGTIEVSFPDGSVRLLQTDGTEKWVLPDGTIAETFPDGDKILSFPNGQREVHTKEHKRREYPDGTVKLVYPDGTQETRYSTGRVRVKDKDGNLIMDVHHQQ